MSGAGNFSDPILMSTGIGVGNERGGGDHRLGGMRDGGSGNVAGGGGGGGDVTTEFTHKIFVGEL